MTLRSRLVAVFAALVLLAVPVWAVQQFTFNDAISDTSSTVDIGFDARYICVENQDTSIIIYVDLADDTATTDDYPIATESEKCWPPLLGGVDSFGVIAASGTPTIVVGAWR